MSNLVEEINEIGKRLVKCDEACEGIVCDGKKGIIPRCLYLDNDGSADNGCVVVGLNPGRAGQEERSKYIESHGTYESVMGYWKEASKTEPYVKSMEKFVRALNQTGPILWTELVKCERNPKGKLPLQTFRTCTGKYLRQELALVPETWPLFAVGREAYTALAYLYPGRIVVGVPHPTGSHGHFARLFKDGKLKRRYQLDIRNLWKDARGLSVWITDVIR